MEQHEALPISDHVAPNEAASRRPLSYLAVLSTVILPVALIPYLACRRSVNSLRRQLDECTTTITKLQRDLKTTTLENTLRQDEHTRLRGWLTEMKGDLRTAGADARQEASALHVEMMRDLNRLHDETEQHFIVQDKSIAQLHTGLHRALIEARDARIRQFSFQKDLGTTLAEIAAFMHEQSLSQGNENSTVERIRWFAHSLQRQLPVSEKEESTAATDMADDAPPSF